MGPRLTLLPAAAPVIGSGSRRRLHLVPTPPLRVTRLSVSTPASPEWDEEDTLIPATLVAHSGNVVHVLPCPDLLSAVLTLREGEAHQSNGWALVPLRHGDIVRLELVRGPDRAVVAELTPRQWDEELNRLAGLCRGHLEAAGEHLLAQVLAPLLEGIAAT